jgi:hypothetical protein
MTKDEIIEMWKNSGDLEILGMPYSMIEAFAKLVAVKEREACAKVCDELVNEENSENYRNAANWCSIRIRARGEA